MFILWASGGQKPQFWANFDFCGRLDRLILSPPGGEKPSIFAIFWTSTFSDVDTLDSWRQSEKVEHGCTVVHPCSTFSDCRQQPLSNGIKIISVLQRHGEIGRTNSDVQKRDGPTKRDGQKSMTDRQKTQRFFATPAVGEVRATPNLVW